MLKVRVIPCLLLRNGGLVKSVNFKNHKYVGDPINAVKIFNDKEVDELMFIDIEATKQNRGPNYDLLSRISREAFMPLGYGGGVKSVDEVKKLTRLGIEKVSINSFSITNPDIITQAADVAGSQSIVASIDVKKDFWGKHKVYDYLKNKTTNLDPVEFAVEMEKKGAGEILLNSVDNEGTFKGYDIDLINKITSAVSIPVIASGGAGSINDFAKAINEGHASAVSAGSFFVFYGPHKAVLITYPEKKELKSLFN
jgi:cyclase